MRRLTLAALALLLTAGPPVSTRAQYSTAADMSWYDYGVMRQITIDQMNTRDAMRRRQRAKAPSRNSSGSRPARTTGGNSSASTPRAQGTTTFRPVAAAIMPQQLARGMARTPAEQQKLERMFSDLLENYRSRLRQSGGDSNDVARAASYLVAASQMVYFDAGFMSDDKYDALRAQMREVFATDAQFQRMTDRERQQLFESYGIAATWIDAGYRIVKQKGDQQAMKQWREMARRNFANMLGASPEQVRFTSAGVEYQ